MTIALGIGANAAIYSVIQAVWIDAVPFRDPGCLVVIQQFQRSWNDFVELRDTTHASSDLIAFQRRAEMVQIDGQWRFLGAIGTTDTLFSGLGVAPRLGRPLTSADLAVGARPVVLLTHGFWQDNFGGYPAVIGRTIRMRPNVYVSLSQSAAVQGQALHIFVVRTTGAPVPVVQRLAPRIKQLIGNTVSSLTALDTFVARSVHVPRFRALLFGLMGLLVVVLTAVGVFSVTAHVVAQRRREMGIRMAVGAQAREVLLETLRQTLVPILGGAALGAFAAYGTAALVAQFLFATAPRDAVTFAAVVIGVIVVALAAAVVPARRALRINPLDVLRLD